MFEAQFSNLGKLINKCLIYDCDMCGGGLGGMYYEIKDFEEHGLYLSDILIL